MLIERTPIHEPSGAAPGETCAAIRSTYAQLSLAVHVVKFRQECDEPVGEAMPATRACEGVWTGSESRVPRKSRPGSNGTGRKGRPAPDEQPIARFLGELSPLRELVRSNPEAAWEMIQDEFRARGNALERACIAAGPLEDLLVLHGPMYLARIELFARSDRHFAGMLHAVWRSGVDPTVWTHLQRLLECSR